jgi:hypothetical protein
VPVFKLWASMLLLYMPARLLISRDTLDGPPAERVCTSVVLSVIAVYLVHETALILRMNFWWGQFILAAMVAAGLVLGARRIVSEWPVVNAAELGCVGALGASATWVLLVAITQANLAGGGWGGDWWEQFQRMIFYAANQDWRVYHGFDMTSRPPAFNVVAAAVSQITGSRFSDYQTIHTVLGSLVLVPAVLLFNHLYESALRKQPPVAWQVLFGLSLLLQPMVVTNLLYPWSRMFTSFLVLAGLYYYLTERVPLAFLCLGAAMASHYSTLVILIPVAVDYLYRWKTGRARQAWLALVFMGVPLAPWILWGMTTYGWKALLTTNTTSANLQEHGFSWVVQQWIYNLQTTFVPFIKFDDMRRFVSQPSPMATWYDTMHLYWSSTFIGSLTTAVVVTLVLIAATMRRLPTSSSAMRLVGISAAGIGLSFFIVPEFEVSGIIHVCSQPMIIGLFALAFVAIADAPLWIRRVFAGMFLIEGWGFYFLKTFDRGRWPLDAYTAAYGANWSLKQSHQLRFLYDEYPWFAHQIPAALLILVPLLYMFAFVRAGEVVNA